VEALSEDTAEWLRDLAGRLHADPAVPAGVIIMESGTERIARTDRIGVDYAREPPDAAQAEAVASFVESYAYCIRLSDRSEPVRCECCGTLIALTPETKSNALAGERARWKPGIWEYESLRKHTMRRCEWRRANP